MWVMKSLSLEVTQFVSLYNNLCVGVSFPVSIGSAIGLFPCNSSDPLQQFAYNSTSFSISFFAVAGLCVQAGENTPSCDIPPFSSYPYCNPLLSWDARVADLLSRMTVAEKTNALDSSVPGIVILIYANYCVYSI